jgi:hypothetical protein
VRRHLRYKRRRCFRCESTEAAARVKKRALQNAKLFFSFINQSFGAEYAPREDTGINPKKKANPMNESSAKNNRLLKVAPVLIALISCPSESRSDTVFEQRITYAGPGNFLLSDSESAQILADDFTLASPAQVTSVSWVGTYEKRGTDSARFAVDFFSEESARQPSITPFYHAEVTPLIAANSRFPNVVSSLSAVLPVPATLQTGTPYWFSVYDIQSGSTFLWSRASDGSNYGTTAFRANVNDPWTVPGTPSAPSVSFQPVVFELSGSVVPEPSAILVVTAGLIVFFFRKHGN